MDDDDKLDGVRDKTVGMAVALKREPVALASPLSNIAVMKGSASALRKAIVSQGLQLVSFAAQVKRLRDIEFE